MVFSKMLQVISQQIGLGAVPFPDLFQWHFNVSTRGAAGQVHQELPRSRAFIFLEEFNVRHSWPGEVTLEYLVFSGIFRVPPPFEGRNFPGISEEFFAKYLWIRKA